MSRGSSHTKKLRCSPKSDKPLRKRCLSLARKIEKCTRVRPCQSPACQECQDAFQGRMVVETQTLLSHAAPKTQVYLATLIPPVRLGPDCDGDAIVGALLKLQRRFHKGLKNITGIAVLGCVDVSINEHQTQDFSPHLRPHIWCVVIVNEDGALRELKRSLKSAFPATSLISRPVQLKKFDGRSEGLAYGFKAWWSERGRRITLTRSNGSRQTTRSRRPKRNDFLRLLLLSDSTGFDGRLFYFTPHHSPLESLSQHKARDAFHTNLGELERDAKGSRTPTKTSSYCKMR